MNQFFRCAVSPRQHFLGVTGSARPEKQAEIVCFAVIFVQILEAKLEGLAGLLDALAAHAAGGVEHHHKVARHLLSLGQLRPGRQEHHEIALLVRVGAVGDGETREAALDDLREALQALIAEVGVPDELTLTLNVA